MSRPSHKTSRKDAYRRVYAVLRAEWARWTDYLENPQTTARPALEWTTDGPSLPPRRRLTVVAGIARSGDGSPLTDDQVDAEVRLGEDTMRRCIGLSRHANSYPPQPRWYVDFARLGGPHVTAEALQTLDFRGPGAIDDFVRWFHKGVVVPRSDTGLLPADASPLFLEPLRDRVVGQALAFMERTDERPILVLHQEAMPIGLTALAAHLCRELERRSRHGQARILYLPLHPHGPERRRTSFPQLIAWIKAHYDGLHLKHAVPAATAAALRKQIDAVRARMRTNPLRLVLDGHRSPGDMLPSLHAAMSDDPLLPLLEELIYPDHGADGTPPSQDVTGQNRILILADRDITHHKAFRTEIDVPVPDEKLPEVVDEVARRLGTRPPAGLAQGLKDTWPDCRSDLGITLAIRLALPNPRDGIAVPDTLGELYQSYLRTLDTAGPGAPLVLRLVALSADGLRLSTLQRIVADLEACAPATFPWNGAGLLRQSPAMLDAALARLVTDGVVERSVQAPDTADPIYEVAAFSLRAELVGLGQAEPACLALLHRLVAEEALTQHTQRSPRLDWRDRADVGARRALWQFFAHAYLSLAQGPQARVETAESVHAVLPAANDLCYRRLYAVFFRTLLEGPGHRELSRVMGRDGLKADILTLALAAGRPDLQDVLLGRTTASLLKSAGSFASAGPPDPAAAMLLRDVNAQLRRALFHLKRYDDLAIMPDLPSPGRTEVKLALDVRIEKADSRKVLVQIADDVGRTLRDAGFPEEGLRVIRLMGAHFGRAGRWDGQSRTPVWEADQALPWPSLVDAIVAHWARDQPAHALAAWSDLLCRRAEAMALANDGFLREPGSQRGPYIDLLFAEKLRRAAFDAEPLGRTFHINGRSTRVMVRVCLRLHAEAVRSGPVAAATEYSRQAERHIGILTRYFERYPSEMPDILVLRARFVRVVQGADSYAAARALLNDAERKMEAARDRPAVRMMLLLERCSLYRARAHTKPDEREALLNAARAEAARLWLLSETLDVAVWTRTAGRELASLPDRRRPGSGQSSER